MPKVSQFRSTYAKTPAEPVEMEVILRGIKDGKWEKEIEKLRSLKGEAFKEFKKRLPAFTATGVFTGRNDAGFVEHSGLVQLDIDGKHNEDVPFKTLWKRVISCPYVYAAFRSPSGKGIKALFRCPEDRELHSGSHVAGVEWLSDNGVQADVPVSALSQLCYVSHDPDLFINKAAKKITPAVVEKKDFALAEYDEERTDEEILQACESQWGEEFTELWEGDYENQTDDQSKADFKLISMLRDNCFSNERVAELFEKSGLYRGDAKWGGRTRDYVLFTLRKTGAVQALATFKALDEDPEDPSPPKKKKKRGWLLEYVSDIGPWTPEGDNYIVKKMIYTSSVSMVFGAPGSAKTFFVLDLAASIASGREWQGRKVKQGGVLYFGLEGKHGIKKRIQALKMRKLLKEDDPFARVLCKSDELNLMKEEHVMRVVNAVKEFQAEKGVPVQIIFIDTLAKAIAGGDENSSQDMGLAMAHAQMIADLTGCHVCVVHHSGKDSSKGARGSSVIRGAVDGEFEVFRHPLDESIRVFRIRKQRDERDEADVFARLQIVSLGVDADLEEVTTCVVEYIDASQVPVKESKQKVNKADAILMYVPEDGIEFTDLQKATAIPRSTLQRRLESLYDDSTLRKDANGRIFPGEDDTDLLRDLI